MKGWMRFAAGRLASSALTMAGASALLFSIAVQAPGDFLSDLRSDPRSSQSVIEAEEKRLGIEGTWVTRYGAWMNEVRRGNWGNSYANGMPVGDLLWARLAQSLWLVCGALLLAWTIAGLLASLALRRPDAWADRFAQRLTFGLLSLPDLVLVLLAAWALAHAQRDLSNAWGAMAALSLCVAPGLYWQMRAALLRASHESFVAAARTKEISEWIVTSRYLLPAAAPELAALAGLSLGWGFSASLLVECTLGYAGIGPLAWNAILARDLPVVVGATMAMLGVWLAGSLAADLMQFAADPRTRRPLA